MKAKSMIYEHPETGLRIVVRAIEETTHYEDQLGNQADIVTCVRLKTEAGQPCTAHGSDDDEVSVLTSCGVVRLRLRNSS